jgi:hypothetical protein
MRVSAERGAPPRASVSDSWLKLTWVDGKEMHGPFPAALWGSKGMSST